MAIVADSGALYALYDKRDRNHRAVREALQAEDGPILIPAALLSEIDYLLRVRIGFAAEHASLKGSKRARSRWKRSRSRTLHFAASFW